jgi:hypothetical protein
MTTDLGNERRRKEENEKAEGLCIGHIEDKLFSADFIEMPCVICTRL